MDMSNEEADLMRRVSMSDPVTLDRVAIRKPHHTHVPKGKPRPYFVAKVCAHWGLFRVHPGTGVLPELLGWYASERDAEMAIANT